MAAIKNKRKQTNCVQSTTKFVLSCWIKCLFPFVVCIFLIFASVWWKIVHLSNNSSDKDNSSSSDNNRYQTIESRNKNGKKGIDTMKENLFKTRHEKQLMATKKKDKVVNAGNNGVSQERQQLQRLNVKEKALRIGRHASSTTTKGKNVTDIKAKNTKAHDKDGGAGVGAGDDDDDNEDGDNAESGDKNDVPKDGNFAFGFVFNKNQKFGGRFGFDNSDEDNDVDDIEQQPDDVKEKVMLPASTQNQTLRLEILDQLLAKEGIQPRVWKPWGWQFRRSEVADGEKSDANDNDRKSIAAIAAADLTPTTLQSLPCYEGRFKSRDLRGFLFIKPAKSGSSTGAALTLRIATRVFDKIQHWKEQTGLFKDNRTIYDGMHDFQNAISTISNTTNDRIKESGVEKVIPKMCKCSVEHILASKMGIRRRKEKESFLWSVLRDPTKRSVSHFFHFQVSRRNISTDDITFQKYLQQERNFQDYFIRYLMKDVPHERKRVKDPVGQIRTIMEEYNFLALTERLDESAVLLQMLLGLDTEDILFLKSKTSGGYDDGKFHNKCFLIQPSHLSQGMQDYFQTNLKYRSDVYYDELFHHAVNRSLDLTIEAMGRNRFQQQLKRFLTMQSVVHEKCASQVRYPCTADGVKRPVMETDCIFNDWGCGFTCMDRAIEGNPLLLQEI